MLIYDVLQYADYIILYINIGMEKMLNENYI